MKRVTLFLLAAIVLLADPPHTTKDPRSMEDFSIDWSRSAASNAIVTSEWSVSPSGLTVVTSSNTTTTALVRLQAGTEFSSYTVTNTVTLTDGQIKVKSFIVDIQVQ